MVATGGGGVQALKLSRAKPEISRWVILFMGSVWRIRARDSSSKNGSSGLIGNGRVGRAGGMKMMSGFFSCHLVLSLALILGVSMPAAAVEKGQWNADWESLRQRPYPEWFNDAKLGIFIHWGLYSVPSYSEPEAYAEWFLRGLQLKEPLRTDFVKRVYGKDFNYRDFAPLFKAELFDAGEWAEIFKQSGARYVLLVSKHHDGYCLWPSKYAPGWNCMDVGPMRDIVGELSEAVRAEGMKMGLYFSLPEWNHALHRWYTDPNENITRYVEEHMIPQFKELVSSYRPSLVFADGEWFHHSDVWHSAELLAWYFNLVGDEAIVNNRWGRGSDIGYLTPEYSSASPDTNRPWAEVRGLGRSFGLNRNEKLDAYMSPQKLIHFFVNAVAHGGGVTLNVGPAADGQIPLLQQQRLRQLGDWLEVNGEAIFGSRRWRKVIEEKEVTLERIDPKIDFNWARNSPGEPIREDHFSAEWQGFLEAQHDGLHHIEAKADEGVRVWIDGKLVVDQWKAMAAPDAAEGEVMEKELPASADGSILLKAGNRVPIRVAYREDKREAAISLAWRWEGQALQVIPQASLFSGAEVTVGDGLMAVYRSMAPTICYTQKGNIVYAVALEWPGEKLWLPIELGGDGLKISLLGCAKPLSVVAEADGIQVDLRAIQINDLPCNHAWTFKIEGLE